VVSQRLRFCDVFMCGIVGCALVDGSARLGCLTVLVMGVCLV